MPTATRWSFRSSAAAGPGGSSRPRSTRRPAACWRWASRRASTSRLWATNVPEWVVLQFATARIGAVLVTINPAYRPFELQYVLEPERLGRAVPGRSVQDVRLLRHAGRGLPGARYGAAPAECNSPQFPQAAARRRAQRHSRRPGCSPGTQMVAARRASSRRTSSTESPQSLKPTQPINIQYTSGTTGFPKAATLSHRNLLLNAYYVGGCQRFTADDRICIPVPFYHCFGCVLGTLACAVYGAAMIVPAEYFQADGHARRHRERAGHGALRRADDVHRPACRTRRSPAATSTSLRTGIMAGSPCPIEVMRQVIDKLGAAAK